MTDDEDAAASAHTTPATTDDEGGTASANTTPATTDDEEEAATGESTQMPATERPSEEVMRKRVEDSLFRLAHVLTKENRLTQSLKNEWDLWAAFAEALKQNTLDLKAEPNYRDTLSPEEIEFYQRDLCRRQAALSVNNPKDNFRIECLTPYMKKIHNIYTTIEPDHPLYDEAESKKYNFVPNRLEDAEINFIYETDKNSFTFTFDYRNDEEIWSLIKLIAIFPDKEIEVLPSIVEKIRPHHEKAIAYIQKELAAHKREKRALTLLHFNEDWDESFHDAVQEITVGDECLTSFTLDVFLRIF